MKINKELLRNLPISKKLWLITGSFSIFLISSLLLSSFFMMLLSDTRAIIAAKSLWASSHRQAAYALAQFINFRRPEDYQSFVTNMEIPLADRVAFTNVLTENPSISYSAEYFVRGGLLKNEAWHSAALFIVLKKAPYVREALNLWYQADQALNEYFAVAAEVPANGSLSTLQQSELTDRLAKANTKIYAFEKDFDKELSDGAQILIKMLTGLLGIVGLFLILSGIFIASKISRILTGDIEVLKMAATKVAAGNYKISIDVSAKDEVGDLAKHFAAMARQREDAEEKLSHRATELTKANAQMAEAEKLKSEFFANVSHELRTPLTLVLTPLEALLMRSEKFPKEELGTLQVMHNNATRLLQMVTGLLDFSKFQASAMTLQLEKVNIFEVSKMIFKDFESIMDQKRIKKTFNFTGDRLIMMDRYVYERIVFNLLSNAVKFTQEEGSIEMQLECSDDWLYLHVQDTGIGISEEDQSHLFEKFRQAEGSSTRKFEGTGLGLSLVKEFSELLGGSVKIDSKPGAGAKFIVNCKAAKARESDQETGHTRTRSLVRRYEVAQHNQNTIATEDVRPKILVADDNPEMANFISSQISQLGQVRVAEDGDAAFAEILAWRPDLVLSDVMMPKRDGLSLCRDVRSTEEIKDIPVILLTALTHRDALLKGWEAGADEYLFKPFHPTELLARVKSVLAVSLARKQIKQKLLLEKDRHRQEAEFLSLIIDRLPIAMFCKKIQGESSQFVAWNQQAENLWHVQKTNVMKNTVDKSTQYLLDQLTSNSNQTDITHQQEQRFFINGKEKFVDSWEVPINSLNQQGSLHIGLAFDVTSQRNLRETLKLEKQKNIMASKLASLGEMAGGIAHEINNPLTVIRGNTELILSQIKSGNLEIEAVSVRLKKVLDLVDRIARIITNLRKFARDASNDAKTDVPLVVPLRSAIDLTRHLFTVQGATLNTDSLTGFSEHLTVLGSEIEISQVFVNLLNNAAHAIEHTENKKVEILLSSSETYVEILICDYGTGIADEHIDRIFDPFFSTKDVNSGTGLGLSISRSIIENLSGSLTLESPRKPTKFKISLPIAGSTAPNTSSRALRG